RILPLERTGETLKAPPEFMLVVSDNPGYQNLLKGMKPSTRQRFIALSFDFPEAELETEVLIGESGIDRETATRLVQLGASLRALQDHDLEEGASTRLLVYAATLINSGMAVRDACKAALVEPLTDDDETLKALLEVVDATLG
ncbi:MAG: CbbQ/NirQ/NorQ/GpvN family protein, partial [Gammaproteobacteria bacterium]|nr:CbbQ/NirQ/NorQ/GpvN family protein [Gammaproteobacteria bacterium]